MPAKRHHLQIALVGASPTPVYQGILHLKPNQVILVCSESTKEVAENIRSQLPMYEDKDVLRFEMSDNDLEKMYLTAELIEQSIPKGITVSMNITGGMKLWSVIFNNVFRRRRRSCRIFCIGQNGTFFDLKEKATKGKVDFDMDAQFKLLGHTLHEYTSLSDYTSEDFDVLNRIQSWGFSERYHYPLFKLTQDFAEQYKQAFEDNSYTNDFCIRDKYHNTMSWKAATHTFEVVLMKNAQTFSSPHAEHIVLNTGWFELYTARLIGKKYGAENIRLNCIFRNTRKLPKNEIDIVINTGQKLIFVECKTQVAKSIDVDKFNSAVRNYGGLGSRPLFVTNSPMASDAKEKCVDHGITTFHFNDPNNPMSQAEKVEALAKVIDDLNKTWNYK